MFRVIYLTVHQLPITFCHVSINYQYDFCHQLLNKHDNLLEKKISVDIIEKIKFKSYRPLKLKRKKSWGKKKTLPTSQLSVKIRVKLEIRLFFLGLMSKWFFVPNIFSLCIFAFHLCLYQKRLTWSNEYLEVIFHAIDVLSITFATVYVKVKNWLCVCIAWGATISKQWSKTIKLLSIEQLILYLAQLNPFTVLTRNHTQYW